MRVGVAHHPPDGGNGLELRHRRSEGRGHQIVPDHRMWMRRRSIGGVAFPIAAWWASCMARLVRRGIVMSGAEESCRRRVLMPGAIGACRGRVVMPGAVGTRRRRFVATETGRPALIIMRPARIITLSGEIWGTFGCLDANSLIITKAREAAEVRDLPSGRGRGPVGGGAHIPARKQENVATPKALDEIGRTQITMRGRATRVETEVVAQGDR